MSTPSIQTLRNDAQQVLNLDSISAVRSVVAATLANANAGTPLNPNLTTQQLWNEFYQIATQPKSDIESIIANQLMKFAFSPPAPGGSSANQQVIFNDAGVLAGDPDFLWNKTTNLLTVTGAATITGDLTVRTNKLAVTSSGVGIGTTSPNSSFQATLTGLYGLQIRNADTNFSNINIGCDPASGYVFMDSSKSGSGSYLPIRFSTSDLERMRIDTSGNLGLGVTPSAWATVVPAFQLGGGGTFLAARSTNPEMYIGTNAHYNGSNWLYKTSNVASYYGQDTGVHKWFTAPSGTANTTAITSGVSYTIITSGNQTAFGAANNNVGTVFTATSSGTLSSGTVTQNITFTQAMTLDAVRNLHVDTVAYVNTGTGLVNSKNGFNIVPDNLNNAGNRNWNCGANLSAAGALDWVVSSANNTFPNHGYRMQLTSAGALNNSTGSYGTISDLRLKENISDARNYLADLLKLRVVKYSLKEEASAVATKLGFIAQEVEQVFPNLVEQSNKQYEGAEGIRSVKTSILIPMLLKAIQELTARVQTLETR